MQVASQDRKLVNRRAETDDLGTEAPVHVERSADIGCASLRAEETRAIEAAVARKYRRGQRVVGTHGAECRDPARAAFPGSMQDVFELADLVATVLRVALVVVFDGDSAGARVRVERDARDGRWQVGERDFLQALCESGIRICQKIRHGQRLSKCIGQRECFKMRAAFLTRRGDRFVRSS